MDPLSVTAVALLIVFIVVFVFVITYLILNSKNNVTSVPPEPQPPEPSNKHKITIKNNCPFTIYPASLNNSGIGGRAPFNGGATLGAGEKLEVFTDKKWAGRIWARTGCNFLDNGNGICLTGDCNGKYFCEVSGNAPATLAEFNFDVNENQLVYDGSNVDGFNLPMNITFDNYQKIPNSPTSCTTPKCPFNINSVCPTELQVKDSNGTVVGCLSACKAGLEPNDLYCCSGKYSCSPLQRTCPPGELPCDPNNWPVNYADNLFGNYCPNFYTYPYSDDTALFYCENAPDKLINVTVEFCPAGYDLPAPQAPTYTGFCCDGITRCDPTSNPAQVCPDGTLCPVDSSLC